jgi:hypothetical protein
MSSNPAEGAPVTGAGVVGRDREIAAVAAFLDAVPSGPCGLLLEGAAGIGKTTVWSAGAALAAERSYTVLSCRPAEVEAALSFAALGDLLDGVLDGALPQLPLPQRRAKHKRIAKQHLDRALEIFESLPAPTGADRARAELSRLGIRPPRSR